MAKFHSDKIDQGTQAILSEIDSFSWMDQWSVPGAPTIWEHLDNQGPFYIPQLRTNDWAFKLGLMLPRSHYVDSSEALGSDLGIDTLTSFEGAVRDVSCASDYAEEYWIYVSSFMFDVAMPDESSWDTSFRQLLEYHNAHPAANNAKFAYIECASSPFLCNVWQIESPALVHFLIRNDTVLDEDTDPADYDANPENLRAVEVRIIDLGLQEEVSLVPPGIFPTAFEQMTSLTTNPGSYGNFEEYNAMERELERFNQHFRCLSNKKGSFLDIITELDNWTTDHLAKPLGLDEVAEFLTSITFTLSLLTASLVDVMARFVSNTVGTFLGRPTEFQKLEARLEQREAGAGGLFGDLVGGFVNFLESHSDFAVTSDAMDPPGVTAAAERRKELFASIRAMRPPQENLL